MHTSTFWITEFMSQARQWKRLYDETVPRGSLREEYRARIDALTNAIDVLKNEVVPKPLYDQILELEIYCSEKFAIIPETALDDYQRALVDQEKKIASHLMSLACDLIETVIHVERLEQYIERRPLQTLEWINDQGKYTLSNSYPSLPSYLWSDWYTTRFVPNWDSSPSSFKRQGLKTALVLIRRIYPDFYIYLLATFPK